MEEDSMLVSLGARDWASAEEQLVLEVVGADRESGVRGGSVRVHSRPDLVCGPCSTRVRGPTVPIGTEIVLADSAVGILGLKLISVSIVPVPTRNRDHSWPAVRKLSVING